MPINHPGYVLCLSHCHFSHLAIFSSPSIQLQLSQRGHVSSNWKIMKVERLRDTMCRMLSTGSDSLYSISSTASRMRQGDFSRRHGERHPRSRGTVGVIRAVRTRRAISRAVRNCGVFDLQTGNRGFSLSPGTRMFIYLDTFSKSFSEISRGKRLNSTRGRYSRHYWKQWGRKFSASAVPKWWESLYGRTIYSNR